MHLLNPHFSPSSWAAASKSRHKRVQAAIKRCDRLKSEAGGISTAWMERMMGRGEDEDMGRRRGG